MVYAENKILTDFLFFDLSVKRCIHLLDLCQSFVKLIMKVANIDFVLNEGQTHNTKVTYFYFLYRKRSETLELK